MSVVHYGKTHPCRNKELATFSFECRASRLGACMHKGGRTCTQPVGCAEQESSDVTQRPASILRYLGVCLKCREWGSEKPLGGRNTGKYAQDMDRI
jgi:hypothetical protein